MRRSQTCRNAAFMRQRTQNENCCLFLEVVKVIPNRPLVCARHLFLAQRALRVGLRGGSRLFISHLALSFDADSLQRDARHLAAGGELAFDFGRLERVAQFALTPVGMPSRVQVWPNDARIVPAIVPLSVVHPAVVFIRPGADSATRFPPGFESGFLARGPSLA